MWNLRFTITPKNICKSASDSKYWMTLCKCYMKEILLTWHVYKRVWGGGSDAVHSTGLYIKLVQCTASKKPKNLNLFNGTW